MPALSPISTTGTLGSRPSPDQVHRTTQRSSPPVVGHSPSVFRPPFRKRPLSEAPPTSRGPHLSGPAAESAWPRAGDPGDMARFTKGRCRSGGHRQRVHSRTWRAPLSPPRPTQRVNPSARADGPCITGHNPPRDCDRSRQASGEHPRHGDGRRGLVNDQGPVSESSETGPHLRLFQVGTTGCEPATP